jgi:putative tryptophan/tyrosine transport system substrate-binding protein
MRRRDLIAVGAVAASIWSFLKAHAQPLQRGRRIIGVLLNYAEADHEGKVRFAALVSALERLGWRHGIEAHIEHRWTAGRSDLMRAHAMELVALAPDVIVANSTPLLSTLRETTRTIPVVFVQISDPLGSGIGENLSRPGGTITGFADTRKLSLASGSRC